MKNKSYSSRVMVLIAMLANVALLLLVPQTKMALAQVLYGGYVQTIGAISFSPNFLLVGGTTTASATATSGLPVIFTSAVTPSICSVSGSTVTGIRAGVCTITASQPGNATYAPAPQVTQNITVAAQTSPLVSLSPTSLTFSSQAVGTTSAAQNVVLTNTGLSTLTIFSISRNNSAFSVTHDCGSSLAAGANCTLGVTFSPTTAVSILSSIVVTSNAAGSPHVVLVTGNGVPPGAPVCSLTATPDTVATNGTSVLTSSCTNSPTSYTWTGGTCAGNTSPNCTVTPAATTLYRVTGSNSAGSNTASATVTVQQGDLFSMFMLLFME